MARGARTHAVAIIGSGPAAYTAAIYAARADLRPVVFEGSGVSGGALMTTTEVENFPGFLHGILGPELMAAMRHQAERFGADLRRTSVVGAELLGNVKRLILESNEVVEASAVIIATGSKYRTLGLKDEQRLAGNGVSWCATCDGPFFRDQDIAVVGGGDSALEEADYLSRYARSVTLVHRRETFRASQIMQARVRANSKIKLVLNSEVVEIEGDPKLSAVHLRHVRTQAVTTLPLKGLFIAIGHEPRSELVRGQIDVDAGGYILVRSPGTHTSEPGVFACGDVTDSQYRQAVTAAGTGCVAALDTERFLTELRVRQTSALGAMEARPKNTLPSAGNVNGSGLRAAQENIFMPNSKEVIHLTDENFREIVTQSARPVLVDFLAEWCGPCRLMSPVIDELAHDYGSRLLVAKLDVDQCPKTAAEYAITSMPLIKVFVNGEVVHTIVGAKPKSTLVQALKDFL